MVSFSICFARQVAVVARARKRWSWSCQRIRSRESSAFLLFFGWPGISRAWIVLGSLTTFLCLSLDSWHSSSNNDRSRLPDKLLTDNAHADSFAMSEDKWGMDRCSRHVYICNCEMIIHQVLATLVDHRILLKHTMSASILLDGSTITRKTKQSLTCPLFFDFCLHCTKPCNRKTLLLVLQETGLMTSLGTCLSQVGRDLDILSSTSIRFGGCL